MAGAASTGAVIQQEPYPMACAALQSSWMAPPRLWMSGRWRSRSRSSRGRPRRSCSSSASEWYVRPKTAMTTGASAKNVA